MTDFNDTAEGVCFLLPSAVTVALPYVTSLFSVSPVTAPPAFDDDVDVKPESGVKDAEDVEKEVGTAAALDLRRLFAATTGLVLVCDSRCASCAEGFLPGEAVDAVAAAATPVAVAAEDDDDIDDDDDDDDDNDDDVEVGCSGRWWGWLRAEGGRERGGRGNEDELAGTAGVAGGAAVDVDVDTDTDGVKEEEEEDASGLDTIGDEEEEEDIDVDRMGVTATSGFLSVTCGAGVTDVLVTGVTDADSALPEVMSSSEASPSSSLWWWW